VRLQFYEIEDRPVVALDGSRAWVWSTGLWRQAPGLVRKAGYGQADSSFQMSREAFAREFQGANLELLDLLLRYLMCRGSRRGGD
jgi:hypothetical protein